MARVGQVLGDDAARGCRDDDGDDWEEESGVGVLQSGLVAVEHDERHRNACGERQEGVKPPKGPGELDDPASPRLQAEDHHVDDGRQTHRVAAKEQGLAWMRNHSTPDLGIQSIPNDRDEVEEEEEKDVEGEEDVRYVLNPLRIVRQVMQQNRNDARAHDYGKPSANTVSQVGSGDISGIRKDAYDGVKFRTILRQPRLFLQGVVCVGANTVLLSSATEEVDNAVCCCCCIWQGVISVSSADATMAELHCDMAYKAEQERLDQCQTNLELCLEV